MTETEPTMESPYAASLRRVPHSRIRELGELAMTMDGVLRLYFGESNVPTPSYIVEAAAQALRDGHTFYSENAGLPSLRREIAAQYRRLHDVELDPGSEIVVTASGLLALAPRDPVGHRPGRRGDHPLARLAERRGDRRALATACPSRCRSRSPGSDTRSTSTRSRLR